MFDLGSDVVGPVGRGTSVLFVGPPAATRQRLLDAVAAGDEDGVLVVATAAAGDAVAGLRHRGVAAERIGVVDASGAGERPDGVGEATVVSGPGDLPSLGIETSDLLERIGHRHERVRVGLTDVGDLVAAVSTPGAFRFLHVLRGRCRSVDAVLLATLDPASHDEGTRRTIAALFDETLTVEDA